MRNQKRRIFGAVIASGFAIAACGGSDGASGEGGGDGGGSDLGAVAPISADEACALMTEADFGDAVTGTFSTQPSDGAVERGCSWQDDEGVLLQLSVTTFESADDLSSYGDDLANQTTVDVPGFDVVATNVGDFVAVGLVDRYQVVGFGNAADVPDSLATEAITRWRTSSG